MVSSMHILDNIYTDYYLMGHINIYRMLQAFDHKCLFEKPFCPCCDLQRKRPLLFLCLEAILASGPGLAVVVMARNMVKLEMSF